MTIFLIIFLTGILVMLSSIFFYFVFKASIRNGINESKLVSKTENK